MTTSRGPGRSPPARRTRLRAQAAGGAMGRYRIRVATGAWLFSGSHNRVQLWLVGTHGEAELQLHLRPARGQVSGQGRGPQTLARWPSGGGVVGGGRPRDSPSVPERTCRGGKRIQSQGRAGLQPLLPSAWSSQPPWLPQVTPGPRSMRDQQSGQRLLRERGAARGQLRDGLRSVTSDPGAQVSGAGNRCCF